MTLGYVMAPAVVVGLVGLFCLVIALGYLVIIKPLLDWLPGQTKKKGGRVIGFFVDVANILPRAVGSKVQRFVKEHVALLLRTYSTSADPLVLVLLQLEAMASRTAGTLADQAEQIYNALRILRQVTIPTLIAQALAPVRAQLQRHTGRLDDLEDLNRRVAVAVGNTLRELPWGVPGGYVTNWETFLGRFAQLWHLGFDVLAPRLNTLLTETIPDLRSDIADLARRLDVQIDARFDALTARLAQVEAQVERIIPERLTRIELQLEALAAEVFGEIGGGLAVLVERIVSAEDAVTRILTELVPALQEQLDQLRLDMEEAVRTGLGVFAERVAALELETFTNIPQRIAALQLAIDTLAAEVFQQVGTGLTALTDRLIRLEDWVFGELQQQLDLQLGRIEAVEANIRDNILPRISGIEAMLAPAAFAALVLAAMRTAAPNLFCRNVTRTSEVLCRADPGLIDDLLAFIVPALVLADLCAFMRLMQSAAEGIVGVISPLVLGAGELIECRGAGSPPGLPLNTTQLPTPTQALAL